MISYQLLAIGMAIGLFLLLSRERRGKAQLQRLPPARRRKPRR